MIVSVTVSSAFANESSALLDEIDTTRREPVLRRLESHSVLKVKEPKLRGVSEGAHGPSGHGALDLVWGVSVHREAVSRVLSPASTRS